MKSSFANASEQTFQPTTKVIGVGGAGNNAVANMINYGLEGVDFIVANTDAQALSLSPCDHKIQLGQSITSGLGAGSSPETGRYAAQESIEEINEALKGSNIVFITAGMGGGTGTGAAPIIAQCAKEMGIITVAVVTKPFKFEGLERSEMAEEGIKELKKYVDTLIIVSNQNLFRVVTQDTSFTEAFKMADNVLYNGVKCITDLFLMPGLINLDLADVTSIIANNDGMALMGVGEAFGPDRAEQAASAAITNPLLEDLSVNDANGILINVTGGPDMTLFEVDEVVSRICKDVDPKVKMIFGAIFNQEMEGSIRVSVVATGVNSENVSSIEKKETTNKLNSMHSDMVNSDPVIHEEVAENKSEEENEVSIANFEQSMITEEEAQEVDQAKEKLSVASVSVSQKNDQTEIDLFSIEANDGVANDEQENKEEKEVRVFEKDKKINDLEFEFIEDEYDDEGDDSFFAKVMQKFKSKKEDYDNN